ncbi:ATP-dependent RNA helicase DDX51 isoform 1 [Schistosoma japonicum]|uniref:ATP-dependent RNA helicase n=1 Tax=Schistosoma japonicum TaxID=6182 RepID=A0A4Z2CRN9_SCHJA|nr:ATP-dependent RNA helicase DDX51 isoform 1 [Schistosoma japonicum]
MICNDVTTDNVIGGFTIIEKKVKSKVQNVQEVLPFWITNHEVFSSDLKQLQPLRLNEIGITQLFPVQSAVIPYMLDCYVNSKYRPLCRPRDICICAPTGSGKTLAYAIPIIQLLLNRVHRFIRALVIVPVRDLAVQVFKTFNQLVDGTDIQVGVLAGIKSFSKEQEDIITSTSENHVVKVDIVIATPGRLVDHLYNTPGFSMERLRILVIDEADRVIVEEKQNWYHTLEDVLYYYTSSFNHNWSTITARKRSRPIPTVGYHYDRSVDITLQKVLVSATLTHDPEPLKQFNLYFPILFTSNQIRHNCNNNTDTITNDSSNIHKNSFHTKKRVKSDNQYKEVSNLIQSKSDEICMTSSVGQFVVPESLEEFLVTAKSDIRVLFLVHLVRDKHKKRILCFTNTIDCGKRLNLLLSNFQGIQSKFLSSHIHPNKRQRILNLFSIGMCQILVCTDSMARGMDINDVECVVSYDVPISMKIYIHRIGRTARAGKKGIAYTLLSPNQFYHFKKDLKLVGRKKIKQLPFHQSKWSHFNAEYQTALSNYEKCVKVSDKKKSVIIAKQKNEYNVVSSEEIIRNNKKVKSKHNKNKLVSNRN